MPPRVRSASTSRPPSRSSARPRRSPPSPTAPSARSSSPADPCGAGRPAVGPRRPAPERHPPRPREDDTMNVTVFGATGGVGSQVVEQLRSRGHSVTAYVRNPSKVPSGWADDVTVVTGELSDAAAIDRAVQGADAVVSALGPSLDREATGLPLVEGTRTIIEAMQRHGVRCYVGNGTPSVLDPREKPTWQTRLSTFMAKSFLRRAYDELVG